MLQNYLNINFLIFIYAGVSALLIALITVSFESIKAASTNPNKLIAIRITN